MPPHRSTSIGLLLLASALVLALMGFAIPYVWEAILVRGVPDALVGQSLRLFWLPVTTTFLLVAIAMLSLLGFGFVWKGRWDFGPRYASRIGLAILIFLVAAIVFSLWTAAGIVVGFVPGSSGLVPWRHLLILLGTVFLGSALYGTLANLPLSGVRAVSAVAFVLGVAGGAMAFLTNLDVRRVPAPSAEGAAAALSLVSIILWLVLCIWGRIGLGSGRTGPPVTTAPSRGG